VAANLSLASVDAYDLRDLCTMLWIYTKCSFPSGSSISVTIRGGKKHSGVEMLGPGHIQACLASSLLY